MSTQGAWGMKETKRERRLEETHVIVVRAKPQPSCSPFYNGTTRPRRLPATEYDDQKLACVYVCVVAVCLECCDRGKGLKN